MSSGQMKVRYNWRTPTGKSHTKRKAIQHVHGYRHGLNQDSCMGRNLCSRSHANRHVYRNIDSYKIHQNPQYCFAAFLQRHYPDGHRFQQDNDPKHTSRWARAYFKEEGSTGDELLHPVRTSIPLKTYGVP